MSDPQTLAGGRYLLVKRLGEGGMATVYRAFDQRLQVWRAIKVLLPEYSRKKKIMARFDAEAQTMALLEHPNIVRVYDVDRDGTHAYIVMELVEGGSLVDWLEAHGPMPARLAVDVVVEVCQALQFAHDKGVVHRDIKPHNVMVDRDGVCRLTDFGIARAGDSDVNLTKTGAVMGTWGFMAPEQRSDAKHVDERADIYAMAATLYSLLTDKTPMDLFAADHDASMLEGVPAPLVPILIKATEYRKEKRYATAQEFAAALLSVRDQLGEVPDGTPPLQRDVGPPPPPPVTAPPADEVAAPPAGGETILPSETSSSQSSLTMPPMEDDAPIEPAQQSRAVYAPEDKPKSTMDGGVGLPLLIGVALVLLLVGGGGAWWWSARQVTPEPAPTPIVVEPEAEAEAEPEPEPEEAPADVTPPQAEPAPRTPEPAAPPSRPRPSPKPKPEPEPEPVTTPPPQVVTPPAPEPEPEPEPPPPPQCIKNVRVPKSVDMGRMLPFSAQTCQEGVVTLHYRPVGSSNWFRVRMTGVLQSLRASIRIDEGYAEGVEWYLTTDDAQYGSAGAPKRTAVQGG